MKKQVLALLLILALAFSLASCGKPKSPYAGAKKADSLTIGGIDWWVVKVDEKEGKALLITKDILKLMPYNEEWVDITWETSDMRAYLNGEFYDKTFTDEEKAWIAETELSNDVSIYENFDTDGGNNTVDKVFLLSLQEARDYFVANKDRVAVLQGTTQNEEWWLRTPGRMSQRAASTVWEYGKASDAGSSAGNQKGLRPAMWILI